MWPFTRRAPAVTAQALFDRWFRIQVPEGHPSLDAYEAAITGEEVARLPKTFHKLATDGVERIYQVRRKELEPDREALVYLDTLLDAEMRWKLTEEQDPANPRNLLRVVATEFGCMVGEIHLHAGKGRWLPFRAPNLWRSRIARADGSEYDPFFAVVRQLSDERVPGALAGGFDAAR